MIQKGNVWEVELLIRWSNRPDSDATWEETNRLKAQEYENYWNAHYSAIIIIY